jgi:hypothetical protein
MAEVDYINVGIGIGAATEHRLPKSWLFVKNTNEDEGGPMPPDPIYCDIPAGSRVSARMQSSTTTAGDRTVDLAVWGWVP